MRTQDKDPIKVDYREESNFNKISIIRIIDYLGCFYNLILSHINIYKTKGVT